ncbi:polyprenyl synthetase family protein [Candidatus Woesebacteria bacterium]|nr:polyprenyl synthetase family protein [Candidatus Woesebacteria bacterium]
MDIQHYLRKYKQHIDTILLSLPKDFEEGKRPICVDTTILHELMAFATRGKSLRGVLTILSYELFGGENKHQADVDITNIAAAIELYHAALLIHDDIMDRSATRRGAPSYFVRYTKKGQREKASDPTWYGLSQAVILGDVYIFLAQHILSHACTNTILAKTVQTFMSNEYIAVCFAQMDDVQFGLTTKEPSMKEIIQVYTYKTARYTFAMPLVVGAILNNASQKTMRDCEKLGTSMGLMFQLRDDVLGLFGDTRLGKPIGADITENKKTILRKLLFDRVTDKERKRLQNIFGNDHISEDDFDFVKERLTEYGVVEEGNHIMQKHAQEAETMIEQMNIAKQHKTLLRELITYNLDRTL